MEQLKRPLLMAAALFFVIGLLIYGQVILRGEFVFDDFEYVVGNEMVQDLSTLSLSDPRQVGYLSFALNNAIGGEDPRGYHLFNVLVHIVNALLVLVLVSRLRRLLAGVPDGDDRRVDPAGFLAGLLFLVHPLATQAVSYITQRFTSLAALFYLLGVVLYLAARARLEVRSDDRRAYLLYGGALLAGLLAMRTKEIAFTLPFLLAAVELLVLARSPFGRRRFVFLVPFAALLVVIPLSLFGPDLGLVSQDSGISEITRREKIYDLTQRSWTEYVLTQPRAVLTYVRLLLLPVGLRAVYDLKVSRALFEPSVLLPLALLLALMAAAVLLWRRSQTAEPADAADGKLVSFGILWFFLTVSVESSVIPIKDLIFEHRAYLPAAGFLAACSVLLVRGGRALLKHAPAAPRAGAAFLVALLAVPLAVGTAVRNEVWTSELAFWNDVVKKTPGKAIGYHNRGNAFAKRGLYEEALADMDRTISFFPRIPLEAPGYEDADFNVVNMAKTFMNRGTVLLDMGRSDLAEADFERSRRMLSGATMDRERSLRMADLYVKKGAYRHAIEEYTKVLQWDPEDLDVLNDRANAYSWTGDYQAAVRDLSRIIILQPDHALAYHNRGIAYAWSDRRDKAVADFEKACRMGFQPACESVEAARRGEK